MLAVHESSPRYTGSATPRAFAWATGCSAFFFLVYGGTNWLASTHGALPIVRFGWERFIPFVPAMIVPYVSIDLLFFGSFFLFRESHALHRHARRILFVIAFAGVCFLLFPLQMSGDRPAVGGFWSPWFNVLHGFDHPHNLVPSLHVALSAVLLPAYAARTRGAARGLAYAWFSLITASTLLTHQHHAIDAVTGAALGLVALWLIPEPFTPTPRAGRRDLAVRYAAGALALAVTGVALGPIGWVLFWPALACAIVASAYGGLGAAAFRKREGAIPLAVRVLLLPYLVAARVTHAHYARRLPPAVAVTPQLVICGRACDAIGGAAVLDLACECHAPRAEDDDADGRRAFLSIPVLDLTTPTVDQLTDAVRFVRAHAPSGPVYVRCALGLSRSACVAAAWLIDEGVVDDADDAIDLVRARRPQAVIDPRMRASLRAFGCARLRQASRPAPGPRRTAAALPGS